ncbi:MAG: CerR family C-terminal domain-containing protein [Candidatus Hydrogenedentota bacterium]
MRIRKDGEETRGRILLAALQVFGEKGYRDATHAEICLRAGVNTAAINYHFGSKRGLYQATWEDATARADALYPIDGGVDRDAPPEERLLGLVRAFLQRRADEKQLGYLHNIRMMELVNPTGLLEQAIDLAHNKTRASFRGVLRELLGSEATKADLEMCEMSVMSQCILAYKKKGKGAWSFKPDSVDVLAKHIVRFCLAGIAAVQRETESPRDGASRKAANV